VNNALDPTGGWAKATEATANASIEAIQASRELGHFLSGPTRELVAMLEDHLKVVRFERRVRLWHRVRNILTEKGMTGPTRNIPLNIGVPLLEIATLEEDDDLQEVWARLLVNGGDASSGVELRRAFVSVLAEMTSLDVRNLAQIEIAFSLEEEPWRSSVKSPSTGPWRFRLSPKSNGFAQLGPDGLDNTAPELAISLSNLDRLGCIKPVR
jgi:hypothetical protein